MTFRTRGMPLKTRINYRVAVDIETRCWNWLGAVQSNGYGRIRVGTAYTYAHRASYEAFIGPIPSGLTIDHLCQNKRCANPDHLEAVTQRENNLRSNNMAARNIVKTHCPQGHLYETANLYRTSAGGRACRTCALARAHATRARAKAAHSAG